MDVLGRQYCSLVKRNEYGMFQHIESRTVRSILRPDGNALLQSPLLFNMLIAALCPLAPSHTAFPKHHPACISVAADAAYRPELLKRWAFRRHRDPAPL